MTSSQTDRLPVPTPVRKFTGPTTTCQLATSDSWGYVEINAGAVAITCILPPTGGPYTIFDGAGVAAAHNITIKNAGGTTISTITANGNMSVCAYDGTAMVAILSNAGTGVTTGANNTFSGTNAFTGQTSFQGATFLTGTNYGGSTASSTLSLYSTSGVGTSDAIRFYTGSQVLAASFDTQGRFIEAIGSASTWSGHNRIDPWDIPGQPAPVDGRIGMIVNYADNTSGSLAIANFTNYTSGTRYVASANFTGIALTSTSATWGFNAVAIAAVTGASAQGAQIEAEAYAAGVVAIALTLSVGGDSTNPTTGYITFVSNAAGNSAAYLMQANATSINPLQTSGSVFSIAGNNLHCTNGIDLSLGVFSGYTYLWPGGGVTGSGVALINTFTQLNNAWETISFAGSSTSGLAITDTSATSGSLFAKFYSNVTGIGSISNNSNTGVLYNTTSDYRMKTVHGPADVDALFDAVQVYDASYTDNPHVRHPMFLAHELQEAGFGFVVSGERDAVDANGDPIYQEVDHSRMVPAVVAQLKSNKGRAVALEAENADLRALIAALTEQVTALTGRVTTLETPH